MVRMDICVEALYDKNGMTERGKTLQMLKVMKGAISVSKSKTGDCIFRSNKLEKNNLDRTIRCYRKDYDYISARYDSQKKQTTQRFMKLLDRQNSVNCQDLLEDILEVKTSVPAQPEVAGVGSKDPLLQLLELRLQRPEAGVSGFGLQKTAQTKPKETEETEKKVDQKQEPFVTEKRDIRSKYTDLHPATGKTKPNVLLIPPPSPVPTEQVRTTVHGVVLGRNIAHPKHSFLPLINANGKERSLSMYRDGGEGGKRHDENEEDRDLTNWTDWRLNDKECFFDYIYRQKTRQDDLLMRNALVRIRTEMAEGNSINGYRIRQRLQNESSVDNNVPKSRSRLSRGQSTNNLTPRTAQIGKVEHVPALSDLPRHQDGLHYSNSDTQTNDGKKRPEKIKSILKPTTDGHRNVTKYTGNRIGVHKMERSERAPCRTAPGGLQVILESPASGHRAMSPMLSNGNRADTTM